MEKVLSHILATIVAGQISVVDEDIAKKNFSSKPSFLEGVRNQIFPAFAPQEKKYVRKS